MSLKEEDRRITKEPSLCYNNLAEEKNEELVKIQEIVKQGKIRNDKEFELIKRREEEIWQNNSQIDCSETLRRLMGDYLR